MGRGAIDNFGTATDVGYTLSSNSSGIGGAICNPLGVIGGTSYAGTLIVRDILLTGNSAGAGGAISNDALGTLSVRGSTLSGSTGSGFGVGLSNFVTASPHDLGGGEPAVAGSRRRRKDTENGLALGSRPSVAQRDCVGGLAMAKKVRFEPVPSFNFGYNVKSKGGKSKGGNKGGKKSGKGGGANVDTAAPHRPRRLHCRSWSARGGMRLEGGLSGRRRPRTILGTLRTPVSASACRTGAGSAGVHTVCRTGTSLLARFPASGLICHGRRDADLVRDRSRRPPRRGRVAPAGLRRVAEAGRRTEALAALQKSVEVRKGGQSNDWFLLAMVHRQLGNREEARKWYDRAVEKMEKNKVTAELSRRLRAEAAELLGVEVKMD